MKNVYTILASAGLALSIAATTALAEGADSRPAQAASGANNAVPDGTKADNTARNERDNNQQTLTPEDQSSAPRDLAITTRIREALVADDSLGTNAKNIKVIAVNGHVTLRGPVGNAEEHAKVVAIAKSIVTSTDIHDEIEHKN